MKKLLIFVFLPLLLSACSTTKDAKSSKVEVVKNAVESKRYIIKLERLYGTHGSIFELVPRSNFIIIDGERAIISTAYMGGQYDIKPIAGINMRGIAEDYELTSKPSNGTYNIKLKVNNGGSTSFSLYITVSKSGTCSASVSSLKIDNIRYTGYLVPIISDKPQTISEEGQMI